MGEIPISVRWLKPFEAVFSGDTFSHVGSVFLYKLSNDNTNLVRVATIPVDTFGHFEASVKFSHNFATVTFADYLGAESKVIHVNAKDMKVLERGNNDETALLPVDIGERGKSIEVQALNDAQIVAAQVQDEDYQRWAEKQKNLGKHGAGENLSPGELPPNAYDLVLSAILDPLGLFKPGVEVRTKQNIPMTPAYEEFNRKKTGYDDYGRPLVPSDMPTINKKGQAWSDKDQEQLTV